MHQIEKNMRQNDEKYRQKMRGKTNRRKHIRQKSLTRQIGEYQIDLDSIIGKGAFGQVFKAHKISNPDECFACKHINEKKLSGMELYTENIGKSNKERLKEEIAAHKSLMESEHVVKLYDVMEEKDGYYLFMEMCDIDLGKFIKKNDHLSQGEALDLFRQLIQGYDSLYQLNISHRDLKPQNLLLLDKVLKISDFGFVKVNENLEMQSRSGKKSRFMAESLVGSINYMAPDILLSEIQNKPYNPFKSDVWSMGIILYKMLFGKEPYHGQSTVQLLEQIKTREIDFPSDIPISKQTASLLKKMINPEQKSRISFKMLKELILKDNNFQKQKEQTKIKKKWPSKPSDKEKRLIFYNMLIIQLSFDSANYATLRQIGFEDYQRISSALMTIIHEKRIDLLEGTDNKDDVQSCIKDEIASYHNTFYQAIKQNGQLQNSSNNEELLIQLLQEFSGKLKVYEDFELLLRSVQFFLLNLLLLYNLEKKYVTVEYIFMILNKEDKIKSYEKLKKDNFREFA